MRWTIFKGLIGSVPLLFARFWKDTITIQVTALMPLQFCTCLKYAILYARRRPWPTCRRIGGHRTSVWTGLPSPPKDRRRRRLIHSSLSSFTLPVPHSHPCPSGTLIPVVGGASLLHRRHRAGGWWHSSSLASRDLEHMKVCTAAAAVD
jgi:hypothetical protein